MSPAWQLILGPAGALVLTVTLLWLLLKSEVVVPGRFYEESERRNRALEEEAEKLSGSIASLTEQSASYREQLATANAELKGMREQLGRVERELAVLKAGAKDA